MENQNVRSLPRGFWKIQKYYALKSPVSAKLSLYISVGMLKEYFDWNLKSLRNGISKFMRGSSRNYRCFSDEEALMVDFDSLPRNTKSKKKLPMSSQIAIDLLRSEEALREDINKDIEFKHLKRTFEDLYYNQWPRYLKLYSEQISDPAERTLYAKSHSLISGVLECKKSKWPMSILFEAFRQIMVSEIDNHREPVFYTHSEPYFLRKINECREEGGIQAALVHEMRGKPREYKVKMTGQIKAYIRLRLRDPRRLTIAKIIQRIFRKFNVTLSPSSIKTIKRNAGDRNVLEYDSEGKAWSRQNGLPKIVRFLAENAGDQFQGDWYKTQLVCTRNRIVIRLWAYIVLDVFSKKVVGWALALKPSATQAKLAFKMAFIDCHFLPEEIVIDRDPLYKRKTFKRFCKKLNNLGVITTPAFPNIPTWKAEIESFFAVFQKIHSDKPWYIGESVTSKNKAGNPCTELRKKIYKDKTKMLTEHEMTSEFGKMIEEYNAITNDRRKTISPNDTFRMNPSNRIVPLADWIAPLLFWKAKPKKRIKDDGRIDLQIDKAEYCYQITKAETLWNYKNTDVRMCYDPDDLSKIYIYERFTYGFIAMIEPRMVMTRNNKDEVLKKHKQILREAQQYIKDSRQADEEAANGNTGRKPISHKSLADKLLRRRMRQAKMEMDVASIKVHP